MIIDCISDLHGEHPLLEGGDLLVIAGDLTKSDKKIQYDDFSKWLCDQPYKKKIVIAGNHDGYLQQNPSALAERGGDIQYLCDSGTEFEGLKIWGSPWAKTFLGMNAYCKAFTEDTEEDLEEKWKLIPNDVDILITHSPPYMILDKTLRTHENVGSPSLKHHVLEKIKPLLHVFGHIHEGYGVHQQETIFVNSCLMNVMYEPVNKPIRIEL